MCRLKTDRIIEEAMNAFHNNKVEEAFELLNHELLEDLNSVEILNALGGLHYQSDNLTGALDFWEKSLAINDNQVDILFNTALIYQQNNEQKKALELYSKLLAINPHDIESLNNRGNAYRKLNLYVRAIADYESALANGFKTFEVFYNLGVCLNELGLYEKAIHSYSSALNLNLNIPEIHLNKGIVLFNQYKWDEALESFDKAIDLNKDCAEAYNNKALIYMYKEISQSEENFVMALKIKPNYLDAQFNLATFYLSNGRYEEGLKAYECRHELTLKRFHSVPWLGQDEVKGKVVFVYPEQGLGDFIQFCRYLPMLEAMGALIWLEVPKPLESIILSLGCKFKLVQDIKDGFDYHCPIMSLPLALKTNIKNIPAPTKYLHADPKKIIIWRKKLKQQKRLRVGIVWQGGHRKNDTKTWSVNRKRNININFLKELLLQDIDIFSLQKGADAIKELEIFMKENIHITIYDHTDTLLDFSDTAALIENLDLVITVDTSVAHLSASLGKETWILNRFDTCWRWFSDHRTSSPWYPSVRIFTQKEPGKWEDAVSEIVQELKKYIQK
jgi:tetratricopeptide (TPR) repeat protein